MNIVGRSEVRVDAFDKATGRTKYYDDLAPKDALLVRIKHSTIAHGFVKSVDISKAEKIPGVVKILTCFDVPDIPFPTAGHPWSMDPSHQDIADRHLLNRHVRYYGDDVCAVIAEDEVAAMQAVRAIEVEYEELPFVLDVQKAMEPGAPQLHEKFPNNILKHTTAAAGNYAEAIKEPGLIKVEGWYETPTVQHCHIENHGCFCLRGKRPSGRDQLHADPAHHPPRRRSGARHARGAISASSSRTSAAASATSRTRCMSRCAPGCCTQVGGRCVKLDCSREETFISNRVRHAIRTHIISWLRHGRHHRRARRSNASPTRAPTPPTATRSCAKALGSFNQHYPCPNLEGDAYTVFTNRPPAGAMRGYGMPQAIVCRREPHGGMRQRPSA